MLPFSVLVMSPIKAPTNVLHAFFIDMTSVLFREGLFSTDKSNRKGKFCYYFNHIFLPFCDTTFSDTNNTTWWFCRQVVCQENRSFGDKKVHKSATFVLHECPSDHYCLVELPVLHFMQLHRHKSISHSFFNNYYTSTSPSTVLYKLLCSYWSSCPTGIFEEDSNRKCSRHKGKLYRQANFLAMKLNNTLTRKVEMDKQIVNQV